MEMLEEAGFADAVRTGPGFQLKNGAAFSWGSRYTEFDFTDKFSDGPGTVYQVRRAVFDKILIEEAAKQGVEVRTFRARRNRVRQQRRFCPLEHRNRHRREL